MPGGDRTGPMGGGPMSGRAAGFCAGYGMPGYMNPIPGRGFGMGFGGGRGFGRGRGFGGRGGGRGWRNWFRATGLTGWQRAAAGYPGVGPGSFADPYGPVAESPEQEIETLKTQAEHLQGALEGIRKRIEKLESEAKEE